MAHDGNASILTLDFGSVNTRAALLDVVDGAYRFVASGVAPTTAAPPYGDVNEGFRHALESLGSITGHRYFDEGEVLLMPARTDGSGVDLFTATASAGPPIRAILVGLMPNVSVEGMRSAAASTYLQVVDVFSLADRRREGQQIDAILQLKPDIAIIAGGTEGGAESAVMHLTETVATAISLLSQGDRPHVLFAGNSTIRKHVEELFAGLTDVQIADNVRPTLEDQATMSAERQLAQLYDAIRTARVSGYADMVSLSGSRLMPTARAFGSLIRFASEIYRAKGVLGIDVGSTSTVVAAAAKGELALSVQPTIGVGHSAANLLNHVEPAQIARWLPVDMPASQVVDYIYNKSLAPATLPQEPDELHLEQAVAREAIRVALQMARPSWPAALQPDRASFLLPPFEPIVGSGSVVGKAPRFAQAALMLLDAVQPTGVTALLLDQNNLVPGLGVTATINPMAAVQIFQSNALTYLCPVVSAVGQARPGQTAVRVLIDTPDGDPLREAIPYGSIRALPLPSGEAARVRLRPSRGFDVGFGRGKSRTARLQGGVLGLVIDARGRPVTVPANPEKRRAVLQAWWQALGI